VCRSERLSEHTFGFEEEELKPYFALDNVLDGLFGVCTRLFGVRIERADGEAEVWHPDVGFFKVIDEASGEHLASFFLDPYARPANKRGGAWMGSCVGRSRVLNRKPVAYLTCNGSPPVEGQPSLMTFSEVTTLFHETGHGLQHMLTEVTHAPAAGISGVEWDAVELPSQFMENFCFEEATMYGADGRAGLAKHYQTGQPLPRDLFEKLCKQKTFQAGMGMVRQLNLGALDMALEAADQVGQLEHRAEHLLALGEQQAGQEALGLLQSQGADLVVTDLQMPHMTGIGLARAMSADPRFARIPVMMLTARGHLLREGEADSANIARVVHKPFSPLSLLAEIETLLAVRRHAA
jgi:Zn-dependent oligopeptidase